MVSHSFVRARYRSLRDEQENKLSQVSSAGDATLSCELDERTGFSIGVFFCSGFCAQALRI